MKVTGTNSLPIGRLLWLCLARIHVRMPVITPSSVQNSARWRAENYQILTLREWQCSQTFIQCPSDAVEAAPSLHHSDIYLIPQTY